MKLPLISIVVLNWNKLEDTKECLKSLQSQTYSNFEVILVDNGSSDGSKAYFAKQREIVFVDLPENTGFTGGQIAGYNRSKGEFIALINNDAVAQKDWLQTLYDSLRANSKAAAAGGPQYIWDSENKKFDESNSFRSYFLVDPITAHTEPLYVGINTVKANSISGSGLLIRRKVIENLGYFDDRFFAYYEEADLFARYKRAGYQIIYVPQAKIWHKVGESSKSNPMFYPYHMHRNRFMFAYKNFDQEYLHKFLRAYRREAIGGLLRLLRKDLEDKARVKAYLWNITHRLATKRERAKVQNIGKSYNESIFKDANETVSVVIPNYNYEKFVGEAIESVLAQTIHPLEIIVIDDGSTDNSIKVIKSYEPIIRLIQKPNSGVVDAKNLGIKEAKGRWIVFLDADDTLRPNYLEECLRSARLTKADMVYTGMRLVGAERGYFRSREFSQFELQLGNYINNSALMKKSILESSGGYKSEMYMGYEDWELYLTLSEMNIRAELVPKMLLYYRRHLRGGRDTMASDKFDKIQSSIKYLHPKLFTRRFYTLVVIRKIAKAVIHFPKWIWHKINKQLNKVFYIRKLKGTIKLALKGDFKEIKSRSKIHKRNIKDGTIDWEKD